MSSKKDPPEKSATDPVVEPAIAPAIEVEVVRARPPKIPTRGKSIQRKIKEYLN